MEIENNMKDIQVAVGNNMPASDGGESESGVATESVPQVESSTNDTPTKPELPLIEGYLFKLKHKPSIFGSWTKRYVKTNPETGVICYYVSYEKSLPTVIVEEEVTINKNSALRTITTTDAYLRSFNISRGNFIVESLGDLVFQIVMKDSIEYILVFKTSNIAEKEAWVNKLQTYVDDLERYQQSVPLETLVPILNCDIEKFYKLKSNPNALGFGTWNQRYFQIANDKIEYYTSNPIDKNGLKIPSVTVKKSYLLTDVLELRVLDGYTFQLMLVVSRSGVTTDVDSGDDSASIALSSNPPVYLTLRAMNHEVASLWSTKIRDYIENRKVILLCI